MTNGPNKFVIFSGELTDAPGRMESWTEWLTHFGGDDWEVSLEGTDFTGTGETEQLSQQFTTHDLLAWLQESDSENRPYRRVGSRLRALRTYAEKAELVELLKLIERVRRGTWPPKPPRPKVTAITGITLVAAAPHPRAEHIEPYMTVETTRGAGIMAMPGPRSAFIQCWLGANPFWKESWKCRFTKLLASQVHARLAERLGREPEIAVRFFTIVIHAASIASKYRGGNYEFRRTYPSSLQNSFLRAISVMSSGELEEVLERLRRSGLTPGQDLAVGEMMHGEWIACPGIRFEPRIESPFPKWFAIYDPLYEACPDSGVQSDAAQAPRV